MMRLAVRTIGSKALPVSNHRRNAALHAQLHILPDADRAFLLMDQDDHVDYFSRATLGFGQ